MIDVNELLKSIERGEEPCYWHKEISCKKEKDCSGCEFQPPDDEKINGKNPPVPLEWETDPLSEGDCTGFPICPSCGEFAHNTDRCVYCGQKFVQDEKTAKYNEPPETERHYCFMCGGTDTVVGTRNRANGHFHGKCEKCGAELHV